ncbi:unnamed protein product, partial [Rotaria sordida]
MLKSKFQPIPVHDNDAHDIIDTIEQSSSEQTIIMENTQLLSFDSNSSIRSKRTTSSSSHPHPKKKRQRKLIIHTFGFLTTMSIPIDLPHDVLSYHDDIFYDLVRDKCGGIVEEIFKLQKIRSAQTLLRITDVFDFMNYDSDDLNVLKQKVGFRLNNGQYQIKPGILMDVNSFLQSLRIANDNLLKAVPIDHSDDHFTISQDFLRKHPIIMSLIQYYSIEQLNSGDTDCTAIIPKVTYDINSNSFVGFSLPLDEGRPITDHYRTESFAQLESWFSSVDKSTLLNIHMIQPITSTEQTSSPIILSAYGTNSKYTSIDIIRRWIWIFDECLAKGIRIIGFSTDGDPKYLKAMKLVLGFFASLPNMKISDRSHAFEDPIHVCTKLRNRLLSTTAEMIIGNQRISLDFLSEMIAIKTPPLRFPKHHKQTSRAITSSASSMASPLTKAEIERIVSSAFDDAFKLL